MDKAEQAYDLNRLAELKYGKCHVWSSNCGRRGKLQQKKACAF